MSQIGTIARQGTFDTAPADSIKGNSIKRGDIEIPVVEPESAAKKSKREAKKTDKNANSVSDKSSKDSKPTGGNNISKFANVPPVSTSKPEVSNDSQQQTTSSKGALSSLNSKISKGNSPAPVPNHPKTDDKPRPPLSDSLSKRLRESPRRDPSPSKQVEGGKKARKDDRKHSDSSASSSNRGKQSETSAQASPSSNSKKGDRHVDMSKRKRSESDVSVSDNRPSRPRNRPDRGMTNSMSQDRAKDGTRSRKLSPSRYEDVDVSTPRDNTFRYEEMKDDPVPLHPQKGVYKPTRNSDTRINTGRDEMSRTVPNAYGQTRNSVDSDRRETYEQIRLERDGLIRAEAAYKKRIKQLEDEAKLFVSDVDNLSEENKTLRARMESLETNKTSHVEDVRKENQHLLQRSEKLDRENQELWMDNQKLKTEKSDLGNKVHRLTSDIEALQKALNSTESKKNEEIRDLQSQNKKIESDYDNLKTSVSDLEMKIVDLQSENKALTESLSEKRRELEELGKALQSDKEIQKDLKQSQTELEHVRKNLNNITRELEQFQQKFKDLVAEKGKVDETVKEKDVEIFSMKDALRKRKSANADLQNQIESLKKEIEKLKSENAELRLLKKDISDMKEKVKTLNDELGKKAEGNKKLKREKSDNKSYIEELKRGLANAAASAETEAETFREKLSTEQQMMKTTKEEMERKSNYISKLETETFEMNMKFDSLNEKVRELEREQKEWESKRDHVSEIESNNKKLIDENRRIRQMLVERNMEVTNRKTEKTVLTSRLEKMEKKQVDSDIKVKQLQGWVDDIYKENDPIVVVTTTPLQEPVRARANRPKAKKPASKSLEPISKGSSISLEDLRQSEHRIPSPLTPPSLPAIDFKVQNFGYYDIYKQKLKLMRGRRF
ncbi:myosin-2 heavy chain-like [Haliotis rufescens]|uniref:myosin-2 heavy chain-like n=1 Tax=Haliotis rufescens TaxID=6454 RepID=UPI00201F1228|nr:myosin-2 heavy chain-like [Haliotis rufescens]XP_046352886.2 myosin-2 heavy chain-like [Haliotis rufescens]